MAFGSKAATAPNAEQEWTVNDMPRTIEYIDKSFAIYVVKHYGAMLTWSKEDVIKEILIALENAPAKRMDGE